MTKTELDSFAAAFQECRIPKSEWTHQAHLKMGAWHILNFGKDDALTRLRTGISRLNDSHGVPNSESRGYHETITRVYLHLIDEFLRELPAGISIDDTLDRLLSSRLSEKDFLLAFYSRERLMSRDARLAYVEADLAPVSRIRH